jgi:hypothetical protein
MMRYLGNGPSHLDARGTAANHHKRQQLFSFLGISDQFGLLESHQDPAADGGRVLNLLQPWSNGRPFRMAEVGVRGTRGKDQVVVRDGRGPGMNKPFLRIDAGHVRHQDSCILLPFEDAADWPCDVRRRQGGRRDLVEQGLEVVEVVTVDDSHLTREPRQGLGHRQPSKPCPNDHDLRYMVGHAASIIWRDSPDG